MKKTTIGLRAVVAGLAMLTLFTVSASAEQRPGFEQYVVRNGDTLAKISGRVFGDVRRWREILKENPQVTNANLIFPGDILFVPVPETASGTASGTAGGAAGGAAGGTAGSVRTETVTAPIATGNQGAGGAVSDAEVAAEGGAEEAAAPDTTVPELPVEQVQSDTDVSPTLYRAAGFIDDDLPKIAIVASIEGQVLLGTNDAAIVNAPFDPGTRFTVVRANRRVFHPVTHKDLGWLVQVLGSAEVTCRGERTSTVVLRTMNEAAGVGDYLLPIDPKDVPGHHDLGGKVQRGCISAGAGDGVIVAFNDERSTTGEHEFAYIDRGSESGVAPGQRFTIYREIALEGRVTVGELQVLRAGKHTSAAVITNSVQEVQIGNLLRAH